MPIGSFIMTLDPNEQQAVLEQCAEFPEVEIHGVDSVGQAVVVIDSATSREMESITEKLQKLAGVLSLAAVYLHAEDEIEKIADGEIKPNFSFGRRREKPAQLS